MADYLSDEFLDRVRRSYKSALRSSAENSKGFVWALIDKKRQDIHEALLSERNDAIRCIFAAPATTDLFYGVDNQCKSIGKFEAADFISCALSGERANNARYQAQRLLDLLRTCEDRSVVEVGPGMGRVAYFAIEAGITDYTTIDLPLGTVAQACFLGATVGPESISLPGEGKIAPIKILADKPDRRFCVALNSDSMTEMTPIAAFDYLDWIGRHAKKLISINHERNLFTVAEASRFCGIGLPSAERECPSWPGYREELFELDFAAPRAPIARRRFFSELVRFRSRWRRIMSHVHGRAGFSSN